jgi:hypothetical protein
MLFLGVTRRGGSGFSFQSFVFKEKTKGFPLHPLTQKITSPQNYYYPISHQPLNRLDQWLFF